MIYFTSDQHFGNERVIRIDNRHFSNYEEMDQYMISRWRNRVKANDTIWVLGDFLHHPEKGNIWYLRQLPGHKHLIIGNHDKQLLEDQEALKYFDSVSQIEEIWIDNKQVVLCHYPMIEWNNYYRGSWHIHGHIHNHKYFTYEYFRHEPRALNAGCMLADYTPQTFSELIETNERFKKNG